MGQNFFCMMNLVLCLLAQHYYCRHNSFPNEICDRSQNTYDFSDCKCFPDFQHGKAFCQWSPVFSSITFNTKVAARPGVYHDFQWPTSSVNNFVLSYLLVLTDNNSMFCGARFIIMPLRYLIQCFYNMLIFIYAKMSNNSNEESTEKSLSWKIRQKTSFVWDHFVDSNSKLEAV